MKVRFFNQNEHVYAQHSGNHQDHIKKQSSCEDDAKRANLESHQLVFHRREAKVRVVLHLIQTFGAPVQGRLGQTDKERHEDERQEAEEKHC